MSKVKKNSELCEEQFLELGLAEGSVSPVRGSNSRHLLQRQIERKERVGCGDAHLKSKLLGR
jgi:hypothetical protein